MQNFQCELYKMMNIINIFIPQVIYSPLQCCTKTNSGNSSYALIKYMVMWAWEEFCFHG